MNENTLIDAISNIDEAMIEKHIKARAVSDAGMRKRQKNRVLLKWLSLTACLAVIVSAIPLWALMKSGTVQIPTYNDAHYSAEQISKVFGEYYGSTKYYETVYASDPSYLYLAGIPTAEYLPVYEEARLKLDEAEFQRFAEQYAQGVSDALGLPDPTYKIEKDRWGTTLEATLIESKDAYISFYQNTVCNAFSLYSHSEASRTVINGNTVVIDRTKSDEEIILSLSEIREDLLKIFGRDFRDTKVVRDYCSRSDDHDEKDHAIYVYFYDESAHPLNSIQKTPISDYIELAFKNISAVGKVISEDDELYHVNIRYIEHRADLSKIYRSVSNEKMIPLEDAEKLLDAGYVFGGHICRLCAKNQESVDFSDYDFVGVTYLFGKNDYLDNLSGTAGIPFYVFCKQIGTGRNGTIAYAKTYVPAIEVSGLKEYFESQESVHNNKSWWEKDYTTAPKDEDE